MIEIYLTSCLKIVQFNLKLIVKKIELIQFKQLFSVFFLQYSSCLYYTAFLQ